MALVYSHSNLSDYGTCPLRFNHKHVAKDCPPETKSFQQTTGTKAHDALKKRIKLNEPLPEEFKQYESIVAQLESQPDTVRYLEMELGMRRDGRPCGFWDQDVFLRGRLDLVLSRYVEKRRLAVLVDYKTGKPWDDPAELAIQALLLRANWPDVQQISGFYLWMRTAEPGQLHEAINDTAMTWRRIHHTVEQIERRIAANDWPADDGPLCAWCPVSKEQCHHKKDPPK